MRPEEIEIRSSQIPVFSNYTVHARDKYYVRTYLNAVAVKLTNATALYRTKSRGSIVQARNIWVHAV